MKNDRNYNTGIVPPPFGSVVPDPRKKAFDPLTIIGKTLIVAEQLCKDAGYTIRVTEEDGEHLMVTCDLRNNRINVATVNGNVTKFQSIG